jgi:hypothetical protein
VTCSVEVCGSICVLYTLLCRTYQTAELRLCSDSAWNLLGLLLEMIRLLNYPSLIRQFGLYSDFTWTAWTVLGQSMESKHLIGFGIGQNCKVQNSPLILVCKKYYLLLGSCGNSFLVTHESHLFCPLKYSGFHCYIYC